MTHQVNMEVPTFALGRPDVKFQIKNDGVLLGTLHISKGAAVWFPPNFTNGYKLRWKKFAELMLEYGYCPSEKR